MVSRTRLSIMIVLTLPVSFVIRGNLVPFRLNYRYSAVISAWVTYLELQKCVQKLADCIRKKYLFQEACLAMFTARHLTIFLSVFTVFTFSDIVTTMNYNCYYFKNYVCVRFNFRNKKNICVRMEKINDPK